MKVFVLFSTEMGDFATRVRTLGVFSSVAKVIEKVKDIEINGFEEFFGDEEPVVENHNNGYLEAYLDDCFHELFINYSEIDLDDNNVNIGILNIV